MRYEYIPGVEDPHGQLHCEGPVICSCVRVRVLVPRSHLSLPRSRVPPVSAFPSIDRLQSDN